jgi:hypothetical protein
VKKQTSKEVVHNSGMTVTVATFARLARSGALLLAFVLVACTSVTPPPSLGPTLSPGSSPSPVQSLATPGAGSPAPTQDVTPTPVSTSVASGPTPSSGPGSTSSAAAPTPEPSVDPTVAAQIDAVIAQVPPVRELQPTKDVAYTVVSRDDFRNYLASQANVDSTPEWRAAEERFLKRLGLLPQDTSLDQLLLELYAQEVAAYYDPATGEFYIINRDAPFGPIDQVSVAHEYTHALQDQHFDLEGTRIKDPAAGDAQLAQLAAIEGDAVLTSQNWMRDNMSEQQQQQLAADALGQAANDPLNKFPLILRRELEFPYTEGFMFTNDVWGLGGYDSVNQTIQTPPASTEQVLHTDKYYGQEAPVAVSVDDISGNLGAGWSNVYQQTMGELNIQVLVAGDERPPVDVAGLPAVWPHSEAAAGWGGDRLNMYENGDQWLVDWQTAWDTQGDADEFSARVTELLPNFQGRLRLIPGSQTVRFMLASDADVFLALPSG